MELANKFLKALISSGDFDTWSSFQRDFLPKEYNDIVEAIERHVKQYHNLPNEEELRLGIRDNFLLQKFEALCQSPDTDVPCSTLLDLLRNEYANEQILKELDRFLDNSVAFESAQESLDSLQNIVLNVESKINLVDRDSDMQYIELFERDDSLEKHITLGLNAANDKIIQFAPTDYILVGGKRGAGKSLTCSNIAHHVVRNLKKNVLYFTIEMPSRSIIQRAAAIETGIPYSRIRRKELDIQQWQVIAEWWANRFENGYEVYEEYKNDWVSKSFDKLHKILSNEYKLIEPRLEIVYDPALTTTTIQAEVQKRENLGLIIVDYINQVKRPLSRHGQYEWTEQIEISKWLKALAQHEETPVFSPYQIDKEGEARFAKGILDSADAAYILDPHGKEDNAMTFKCTKMRDATDDFSFTSQVNWESLKIGPEDGVIASKTDEAPEPSEDDL